jgi:hypothetical protein
MFPSCVFHNLTPVLIFSKSSFGDFKRLALSKPALALPDLEQSKAAVLNSLTSKAVSEPTTAQSTAS